MTTKRLLATVPAALAGGALLFGLTACGGDAKAESSQPAANPQVAHDAAPAPPAPADQKPAEITRRQIAPPPTVKPKPAAPRPAGGDVNCGPLDYKPNGRTFSLIAEAKPDGTVGCTEAFNVLDEYTKAPTQGSQRNADLSNGWSCATDGGSGASAQGRVFCTDGTKDGHGGVIGGRAFHTQPG
ncbi:hypothetical protein EV193_105187 [Herbihabitans rhizosphaerae]|uniref:Subtilisin inhibitor-like n=1 Tax=Herbihabitans rhizosphaerae TaxID=1872711 RepID=A0A4Q7KLU8_9PSEU|nr:hypothetical protein [Herbihabitans rhizosphaerae]RZS37629.1 hypothetical protein EV193_105187 [Herbihabitans rhizosphaerae]